MLRVGVLRGGTGNEYNESLTSGGYVLSALPKDEYEPVDIFIDKQGVWHMGGVPVDYDKLKHRVDILWNTLHGYYGADGKVTQLLDSHGIRRTGPSPLVSAMTMNRRLLADRLMDLGVRIPAGVYVEEWGGEEDAVHAVVHHVARKLSPPWKVGAISRGQIGHSVTVRTRGELHTLLAEMRTHNIAVLIEQEVLGTKIKTWSIPGFRGIPNYVCVPVSPTTRTPLAQNIKNDFTKIVREIHTGLGLGQYAEIEGVVTSNGTIYITHVEPHPLLHEDSLLHQSLASLGATFADFARHVLTTS